MLGISRGLLRGISRSRYANMSPKRGNNQFYKGNAAVTKGGKPDRFGAPHSPAAAARGRAAHPRAPSQAFFARTPRR